MFDNQRYLTRGVNETIPFELQAFMWDCIDRLPKDGADYFQREFDEKRIEKAAKICYNENNDRLRKQKGGFLYGTNSNFLRYRRFLQRL